MDKEPRGSFLYIGIVALFLIIAVSSITYLFLKQRNSSNSILPLPDDQVACTLEAKLCPDGTAVGRIGPNCEFAACPGEDSEMSDAEPQCFPTNLTLSVPEPGQKVTFPLTVVGAVDNRKNTDCNWGVFEAQAGTLVVKDEQGEVVASGILTAKGEWMTEGPIQVEGIVSATQPITGNTLTLIATEDDPSGLGELQQLSIELSY